MVCTDFNSSTVFQTSHRIYRPITINTYGNYVYYRISFTKQLVISLSCFMKQICKYNYLTLINHFNIRGGNYCIITATIKNQNTFIISGRELPPQHLSILPTQPNARHIPVVPKGKLLCLKTGVTEGFRCQPVSARHQQ